MNEGLNASVSSLDDVRDELFSLAERGEPAPPRVCAELAKAIQAHFDKADDPVAWMVRRSDGEVHWDEVDCIFNTVGSADDAARLLTDGDPDGYTFRAFAVFGAPVTPALDDSATGNALTASQLICHLIDKHQGEAITQQAMRSWLAEIDVGQTAGLVQTIDVHTSVKRIKVVSGYDLRDGTGASDALYNLAVEHGADQATAAGLAHHINGALNELQGSVYSMADLSTLVHCGPPGTHPDDAPAEAVHPYAPIAMRDPPVAHEPEVHEPAEPKLENACPHLACVYAVPAEGSSHSGHQLYTIHDEPVPLADNWRLMNPTCGDPRSLGNDHRRNLPTAHAAVPEEMGPNDDPKNARYRRAPERIAYRRGWNACRGAMLAASPEVTNG